MSRQTGRHTLLLLEPNEWDREQIRAYLRGLSTPVRVLEASALSNGRSKFIHHFVN